VFAPDSEFEGEPRVADALDQKERVVWRRLLFTQHPHSPVLTATSTSALPGGLQDWRRAVEGARTRQRRRICGRRRHSHGGGVVDGGNSHARVSFETERQNRDDDEKYGQRRYDLHTHTHTHTHTPRNNNYIDRSTVTQPTGQQSSVSAAPM